MPTHKAWLVTNHRPSVAGTDHAIWRRLQLVPFTVTIDDSQAVKDMPARLEGEYPGILAWCVRGCIAWQRQGRLDAPEEVTAATDEYRGDEDVLGAFVAEHCTVDQRLHSRSSSLYTRYAEWAKQAGEDPITHRRFGRAMAERGFERFSSNGTCYRGIGLRPPESDEVWSMEK